MAAPVEMTIQGDLPFPVVQIEVAAQVVRTLYIVDGGELLDRVDEATRCGSERYAHIISRHDEGEGIGIVGIVCEGAALDIAAVGGRDGDTGKMVVAADTDSRGDDRSCYRFGCRQVDQTYRVGGGDTDGIATVVPPLDAGGKDGICRQLVGELDELLRLSSRHARTQYCLGVAAVDQTVIILNGTAAHVVANHICITVTGKASGEDVAPDGSALLLIGDAVGGLGFKSIASHMAESDDAPTHVRPVVAGNTAGSAPCSLVSEISCHLAVLNDAAIERGYSTYDIAGG